MAYDRTDWHFDDVSLFKELDTNAGGTHIGMYLAWAIQNNLAGEIHTQDSSDTLSKIKNREMTGTEFLIRECDGKFWERDLNQTGQEFTNYYYTSEYINDYKTVVGDNYPSLYHVEDTWENFDKVSAILSSKFKQWLSSKR